MLSVNDLTKQKTFTPYRNDDGTVTEWYSEHFEYQIKLYDNNIFILSHHCEIDGSTWSINKLKSLDDLKNVYEAITDGKFN